jgi:hypothetical protein
VLSSENSLTRFRSLKGKDGESHAVGSDATSKTFDGKISSPFSLLSMMFSSSLFSKSLIVKLFSWEVENLNSCKTKSYSTTYFTVQIAIYV